MNFQENFLRLAQMQKRIQDRGFYNLDKNELIGLLEATKFNIQLVMRSDQGIPTRTTKTVFKEVEKRVEVPKYIRDEVPVYVPQEVEKIKYVYVLKLSEVNAQDVVVMDEVDLVFTNSDHGQEIKGSAVEQFITNWECNLRRAYLNEKEAFLEEYQRFQKQIKKADVEEREELAQEFSKYLDTVSNVVKENAWNPFFNQELEEAIQKAKVIQKKSLLARIIDVVGQITDDSQIRIDREGRLHGIIVGEKGRAHIKTSDAGGYNIQRRHFRVYVTPIVNDK